MEKKAGGSFLSMSTAGCCCQAPTKEFTAFLERLFPAHNEAENINLEIAGINPGNSHGFKFISFQYGARLFKCTTLLVSNTFVQVLFSS
ncbi:MAG: hypothetical protein Q7U98_08905 [Methylicorpusculum sp.]|uniref:hypothetical protein n=1 Tax=Methylicorpusculum sp. TaxID=2713644 RepID=UPI002716A585|nr:hypothetical protein [Methylicorpusculum sp.]MDO8939268.1 hypothetical protein [Methylicorpusculum sp.]MDO9239549.1 hypothetical protein [Methylicorpusculum sp.]MDP2203838.1 hypothetical protein [Methylicorpusculum sp.]